ncbi:uncharacterized protein LOC126776295 [Nymphalis io]|uniref:uncharacterized protein LOC126776295 n=1 Tax=Inachis io TaxID=171585 RepID=UPI00216A83EB|nr:uncharacterized protein LOC126776295 [Nymphalis io]
MGIIYNIIYSSALISLLLINYIYCSEAVPLTNIYSSFPEFGDTIKHYERPILDSETDAVLSGRKSFGVAMSPPFVNKDDINSNSQKAYSCSIMSCLNDNDTTVVCACNYNTGNVVTFKNSCDVKKHNCRFNTDFNIILNDVCPWEFQSRRHNKEFEIDYTNPKYYN